MRYTILLLIASALVVMGYNDSQARTWNVERDGSGDFKVLQHAADAAAAGDTIRIGPGLYDEFSPYTIGEKQSKYEANVYLAIFADDLTFIGEGAGVTVIGATEYLPEQPFGPIGVITLGSITNLRFENLSVERLYYGMQIFYGGFTIHDCSFTECCRAFSVQTDGPLVVERCHFQDNLENALATWGPTPSVTVRDCTFIGNESTVSFNDATANANVYDCYFENCRTGAKHQTGSWGGVYRCWFVDCINVAIACGPSSSSHLEDNDVNGAAIGLAVNSGSHVSGTGNKFVGNDYAAICVWNGSFDFHGNDFINGGGYTVSSEGEVPGENPTIELTGNYWGTADPAQISAWIFDGHDPDNRFDTVVVFEPFSPTPLPPEKKSLGGVKALFR